MVKYYSRFQEYPAICGDELNLIYHPRLGAKPRFISGEDVIISLYDSKLDNQRDRYRSFLISFLEEA